MGMTIAKVVLDSVPKGDAILYAETLFDKLVEPIDLPGPDQVVDPLLRRCIAPVVSALYDKLAESVAAA